MYRSHSRSQLGAGGGATTSPSPRPVYSSTAAAASSSTNATNAIVKNILKNVESHVRVMSHLENISIASSYTALRVRRPKGRRGANNNNNNNNSQNPPNSVADVGDEEWSAPFSVSRVHKGVTPSRAPNSQHGNGDSASSNTSTFAFYSDVVAPCVSNCCAGQSYLFLFTGPQESGRSQTLYGCPSKTQSKHATPNPSQDAKLHPDVNEDGNERGVVELAAIDFLERITQRQRQRMETEDAEVPYRHAQENEKENRGAANTGGGGGGSSSAGGLVVTFSAFTTRGEQIVDTITHEEVKLEAFPPPLGTVALPYMHLLDDQSLESFSFSSSSGKSHHHHHSANAGEPGALIGDVVPILPEKKYIDTSCIIQFQVYACVDGGGSSSGNSNLGVNNGVGSNNTAAGSGMGKRAMATFTFVDMAAFRAPICKEVATVVDTVRKVAGLAASSAGEGEEAASSTVLTQPHLDGKGNEDYFKSSKLTQLLEPALTGYITLVSVATISGREDLYDGACAALSFSQDIKKIHQVFFLLHILTPRWLFETGCALENLREERARIIKGSYARGVYDYYQTASKWLTTNVSDVEGQLDKLLAETESIRTGIEGEVRVQERSLQEKIDQEESSAKTISDEARRAVQRSNTQFEAVKRLDEEIAQVEQKISHNDLKTSQRIGEMRIEISALDAKKSSREKAVMQLAREKALFDGKSEEVVSVVKKYTEDLAFAQVEFSCKHELQTIRRKRSRLEEGLQMASAVVHKSADMQRSDRERQAMISRLATTQQRVESLRNAVRSSLSTGTGLSEALAGFLDDDVESGEALQRPAKKANTRDDAPFGGSRPRRVGKSSTSPAVDVSADSP